MTAPAPIVGPSTVLVTPQAIQREYGIPRSSVMDLIYRGHLDTVKLPGARRAWVRRDEFERVIGLRNVDVEAAL